MLMSTARPPVFSSIALTYLAHSGKSSMIACLFSLIELHSGQITIDGLDISTLPREAVRTSLIGVPQNVLVIGTSSVRLNADPSEKFADAEIEDALRSVGLWDMVAERGGLGAPINDLRLSHGQKQLFCLVGALLRPSPVVVLDEISSRYAVDSCHSLPLVSGANT